MKEVVVYQTQTNSFSYYVIQYGINYFTKRFGIISNSYYIYNVFNTDIEAINHALNNI